MNAKLYLWEVTFEWEHGEYQTRIIVAKNKRQVKEIIVHIKDKFKNYWCSMPLEEYIGKMGPCIERSWYLIDGGDE